MKFDNFRSCESKAKEKDHEEQNAGYGNGSDHHVDDHYSRICAGR